MARFCQFLLVFLMGIMAGCGRNAPVKPPVPSPEPIAVNSKPVDLRAQKETKELEEAIAPEIKKGQETYPEAKKTYLEGLPPLHSFVILTRLKDDSGASERVFVKVSGIDDGKVTGKIESEVLVVKGYKIGDEHSVPEAEVLDWLFVNPDGSQKGNVVGKFIENWQSTRASK